jgi:nitrilase
VAAITSKDNAMRTVKAAAVQLSPVLYSREGTVDKIVRQIHELGREGVQFATFPETVVPYYPYFSFVQPAYQIVGGREYLRRELSRPSASTNVTVERSTTRNCSSMPTAP